MSANMKAKAHKPKKVTGIKSHGVKRESSYKRGYDSDWYKIRNEYARAYPTCCVPGCGQPTEEVDHIIPVRQRPDLRLTWSNLQALCKSHHSKKTASENKDSLFGRDKRV